MGADKRKPTRVRLARWDRNSRQRRLEALPPAVRELLATCRPNASGFRIDLDLVEKLCELLAPPAELFTPDGAAAILCLEVSGDVLSRAIATGRLPVVSVFGASGSRVCYAITEAAARSIKRQRARAGEARAKAEPQA